MYKHQITLLAINGLVTPLTCSHERDSRTKFESRFASKRPGRNLPDNVISFDIDAKCLMFQYIFLHFRPTANTSGSCFNSS